MISGGPAENEPEESGEPLIDALLDEVLGGKTPPDLKDRIMGRLREKQREQARPAEGLRVPLPLELIAPELVAPELNGPGMVASGMTGADDERPAAGTRAVEAADRAQGPRGVSNRSGQERPGVRSRRRGLGQGLPRGLPHGLQRRWSRDRWRSVMAGLAGVAACLLVVAGLAVRSTAPHLAGTHPREAVALRPPSPSVAGSAAQKSEPSVRPNTAARGTEASGVTPDAMATNSSATDDPWRTARLRHLNLLAGRGETATEGIADRRVERSAGGALTAGAASDEMNSTANREHAPFGSVPFQPLVDSLNAEAARSLASAGEDRLANEAESSSGSEAVSSSGDETGDEQVVQRVNRLLEERWQQAGLAGASGDAGALARVDDEGWCARVYQQLLGRLPQAAERREFSRDESPDKRARLVDRLMTDDRYRREFVEFWAERWSVWLVGDASRPMQQGLKRYLAGALRESRHYDTMWTELLTATGTNQSGGPDHNDATNYLLALWEPSGATVVEGVGRAAWGQRVGCAQCHDDTLNAMSHERFWQAAAVFQSLQVTNLGPGRQRLSENAGPRIAHGFTDLGAPDAAQEPADLEGRPLRSLDPQAKSRAADEAARRDFATTLVRSPRFSRALVNRLWGHFLQYGLTQPVDDMGPHNPTELPGVLEELASQFERRDYALEPLMRWMVLNEAFARGDSIPVGSEKDFPEAGGPPLFSWYYDRSTPLFAEASQGLQALARGAVPRMTDYSRENTAALVSARLADGPLKLARSKPSGKGAGGENANRENRAVDAVDASFETPGRLLPVGYLRLVRSLASSSLTPQQQVEHAVRVVLGRDPRDEEVADAERIHAAAKGDPVVALERVFWVLMNSRD